MARTFWDRWAGLYDLAQRANSKVNREMVRAAAARIPAGADVLDCAAGTGAFSMAAAPRAARVLCTDLSPTMLDRARSKAEQLGLGNISFATRDLLNLEDPDGAYGAVVAANVLHLLPEPRDAVRELWRVVRPGGVLLLPTYLLGDLRPAFRLLLGLYRVVGFRPAHRFTLNSYRAMLESCVDQRAEYVLIPGRIPVGLVVFRKPL